MCEAVLDGALKETWDIIDINLSFVGKYVYPLLLIHLVPDMLHRLNESVKEYPVTCLHGLEECAGNVQKLCAVNHADTQED